jgi:hypothetical protein
MPIAPSDFGKSWRLADGRSLLLRNARVEEAPAIRQLYISQYGDRYTLSEVMDPDKTLEVLTSPDWHWILAECEGTLVASLIFGMERIHRLGKALGGVVLPEMRGHKVMRVMLEEGLGLHLREGGPMDVVYAVVRTFISLSFHHDLAQLGFVDTGIFPNVRKVAQYETHGLKVLLAPHCKRIRRTTPMLIPQLQDLYEIVRSRLGLERANIIGWKPSTPTQDRVVLSPLLEAETPARRKFLHQTTRRQVFNFFPLHGPDLILIDASRQVRAFLSFQAKDGHATILGFTPGPYARDVVLNSVTDYCEQMGCVYLELLVPAYEPRLQAEAYQAGFLPCAYFPAAYRGSDGLRHDYVIWSKTYVPLHFRGLRLTEEAKPYLLEFFKLYTSSLWEDLMES